MLYPPGMSAPRREARVGRYQLVRKIGRGTMAEVFEVRANEENDETEAAPRLCIKRMLPEYAENRRFVKMFENEARFSMALDHPNIARVFDFGHEHGVLYLVMERVDGSSLSRVRRRLAKMGRRLPTSLALHVTGEICKALHHAHTRTDPQGQPLGLVHRDVSPQNVLVSFEGQTKLVDFGIARAATAGDGPKGPKGKIHYMAPEQSGGEADGRADVFGAGATLFELLTGRTPLRGGRDEVLPLLRAGKIPSLSDHLGWADPDLVRLVDTALKPDPDDRWPSALAFQGAVANYEEGHGGRASPDELGALVRFVYTQRLTTQGRTVGVPAGYLDTLPLLADAPDNGVSMG